MLPGAHGSSIWRGSSGNASTLTNAASAHGILVASNKEVAVRYLLDAAIFAAAASMAWGLFDSPASGVSAGFIFAGAWEALQGRRERA
jgi:hypothetical protein